MLNKLKIIITISFAKLPYNIFKACLNLMCKQEDLNLSVTVIYISTQLLYLLTLKMPRLTQDQQSCVRKL